MKPFYLCLTAILFSFSSFAISGIRGPHFVCIGSTVGLTDSATGGTWTSSNIAIATVGSSSGIVSGLSSGTATITYTVGVAFATHVVTVTTGPSVIGGPSTLCVGATSTLTNSVPGGTWTGTTGVASVDTGTGVVTGLSVGTVTIYYSLGPGCSDVNKLITVTPGTAISPITGPTSVCVDSLITLSDATPGGTWSTGPHSTITGGGVLTGVSPGLDTVRYSVSGGCGISTATHVVAINSGTSGGTINGTDSLCIGNMAIFFDSVYGGAWSSSNPAVATVDAYGTVTAVSAGVATISYSYTGCGGSGIATKIIAVRTSPPPIVGGPTVLLGGMITLTDPATGGTWTSSDSSIASIDSAGVVTGHTPGSVTITYNVDTGCTVTTVITVIVPSLVNVAGQNLPGVNIYPNPAGRLVNIRWTNFTAGSGIVRITDVSGREILTGGICLRSNSGNYILNLDGFKEGIYFLNVSSGGMNYNSRLVVER
jgi:trimeric autotransporter adhesin